jgi:colanic acid biosynthesis glycosyl transferase WcaI
MTNASSRVVVHDYSGHPGQAQLSRALASRGYEVSHQHCPSYATGKGSLQREPGDPLTLTFEACPMDSAFNRYSPLTRIRQEINYGRKAGRFIAADRPDVAVISNVPLIAHALIARRLARLGIPMVFWQQDIYSAAITATARKRFPTLGRPIGWVAERVERSIARSSVGVVAISPTFLDKLKSWGVADRTTVVPNWAPIDELPVGESQNGWRTQMGLAEHPIVLYTGTLGLKHDPSILALMSTALKVARPDARVVVISEGKGREWLEEWKRREQADNLVLLDFQPYEDLPKVLASGDLLVAILEPDASKYSVPSKALTYLCASRAILGVIPPDNSIAEILLTHQAGRVVDPSDRSGIADEVVALLADDELRRVMGQAGRRYAEGEFSPERAADRFVAVFGTHVALPPSTEHAMSEAEHTASRAASATKAAS